MTQLALSCALLHMHSDDISSQTQTWNMHPDPEITHCCQYPFFVSLCVLIDWLIDFFLLPIPSFPTGREYTTLYLSRQADTRETQSLPGSSNWCDSSCSPVRLLTYLFQTGLFSHAKSTAEGTCWCSQISDTSCSLHAILLLLLLLLQTSPLSDCSFLVYSFNSVIPRIDLTPHSQNPDSKPNVSP